MKFAAAVAVSEAVIKAADAKSYNPAAANELAAAAALDATAELITAFEALADDKADKLFTTTCAWATTDETAELLAATLLKTVAVELATDVAFEAATAAAVDADKISHTS